ncbi:MAG: TonB-dependent receptor plug domain-containing protein [Bacteroidales bacterium]|nr:TonB-dependent receptor plug domain-containing protein [Bacteroidales bacterium]MBN2818127.1 TonB-dependent receptor plug domain-containing protein [Bacteroidales bacterium]
MKRIFLCFLAGFFVYSFLSAQKISISGIISDQETGESMLSANIYDEFTLNGTVSNNYGFYVLHVSKGPVKLVCSYIGYNSKIVEFKATHDTVINLSLSQNLQIEEVVVTDKGPQQTVQSTQMSQIELKVADIKSAPVLLGEVDIIKTLQLMPGVQGGTEGSSGFFVRGGAPDQNLILLDGVPVYNVNHLFGFFSVFNADAVKNVTLIKGGFPARYGGRLSSVVDIRLKEGNMKNWEGEGSIGLLSSKLTVEGPIKKDTSSILISGRRTYYDILTYPFQALYNKSYAGEMGKIRFGAFFYDLNLKYNHILSSKDRIYLSAYLGKDKFYLRNKYKYEGEDEYNNYDTDFGLGWGNITTALRWNHIHSQSLFSNLAATFSDYTFLTEVKDKYEYKYEEEYSFFDLEVEYYSRIRDFGLKYDFDLPVNNNNYVRYGMNYTLHTFSPGVGAFREDSDVEGWDFDTTVGIKNIPGNEFYVYLEDDITFSRRLKANVGGHFSMFFIKGKTYYSPEPRASARFLITDKLSLKGSYVWMTQYINLLTNSTIGLPTDLWVPSTKILLPQKSWQTATGLAYNLNNKYEITVEGYYKEMENLVEFKEGSGFFSLGFESLDDITTQGVGKSYGAEFMVQKSSGSFRGWLSYTLSKSNRKFEEISYGRVFPFTYDRRHNMAIVGSYDINPNFNFSFSWTYYTGQAFTLPDEKSISASYFERLSSDISGDYWYNDDSEYPSDGYFETRNNYRMPDYHRLDIGVNLKKNLQRAERTWSFGAYNAYFRPNAFIIYEGYDYSPLTGESKSVLKQLSIFPFVPYFRYSLKF